jgi:hypothetical protein
LLSLWETKSLRDRTIQMHLNRAPYCRLPLDAALHFTLKAYPEGPLRSGSLPRYLQSLDPLNK